MHLPHPTLALTPLLACLALVFAQPKAAAQEADSTGSPATPQVSVDNLPMVRVKAAAAKLKSEGNASYTNDATQASTGLSLAQRDTPQSLTVITRQRIDDQGLQRLGEVLQQTTGLSSRQLDSDRLRFSARGFGVDSYLIDGMPSTTDGGASRGEGEGDTALLDRVEILRGAAGLMTGMGSPSASINSVRKKADSKTLTGKVSASVGSWQSRRATGDVSTPLNHDGSLRARLVAVHDDRGSHVNGYRNKKNQIYATLSAELGPSTLLQLGVDERRTRPTGTTWGGLPMWTSDGQALLLDRSASNGADWAFWHSTQRNAFISLEQKLGADWLLRANLTQQNTSENRELLWLSGAPDRQTGLGMETSGHKTSSAGRNRQLNLQANGRFSLLGKRHELLFGLNHGQAKTKTRGHEELSIQPPGNFFRWDGSFPRPEFSPQPTWHESDDHQESALYGVSRLSLTQGLKAIVGARMTTVKVSDYEDGKLTSSYENRNELNPYAGLVQDLGEQISAYASITRIFKPQSAKDRKGEFVGALRGSAKELGLKGEFLDGKLIASAALFRIEQDNLAQKDVGHFVPDSKPPVEASYGAKGAYTQGAELEITGEPLAGWQLSLGLSHFKGKDAKGQDINTTEPRQTAKLYTSYRPGGALQGLTLGAGINWQSSSYSKATDPLKKSVMLERPAYSLVSASVAYEFAKQWSAALHVDNLLDKRYYSQLGFYSQGAWGAPRNFRLSGSYSF